MTFHTKHLRVQNISMCLNINILICIYMCIRFSKVDGIIKVVNGTRYLELICLNI